MTASFNLVDESWIPCISVDGEFEEVSLRDLLTRAHELREISCESAIQSAAILPMALALLHRVFGPADMKAWHVLWQAGAFDMERLDAYFTQWRERFDLFHPEYPFYQARENRVEAKSLIHLIHPIGNTGTLFTHESDVKGASVSAGQAALQLLAARLFRTAGLGPSINHKRVSFKDNIYARGVIFWLSGSTVFQTLMLNLLAYPDEQNMRCTDKDAPAWEMDDPFQKRDVPYGYLDYLTWTNNRIHLIPRTNGDSPTVSEAIVAPALNLDAEVRSPQKRYVQREKKGEVTYSFLYFNSAKALWRDYDSLLKREGEKVRPPEVIGWVADLKDGYLDEGYPLRLMATGMLADQAKPIFYRQEIMPLPLELLRNEDLVRKISSALNRAEEVAVKLRNALNILATAVLQRGATGTPDNNTRNDLVKQWNAREQYWIDLEPLFWRFIDQVIVDEDTAAENWTEVLRRVALDALRGAARLASDSPWALKGGIEAERYLQRQLNELLNEQE